VASKLARKTINEKTMNRNNNLHNSVLSELLPHDVIVRQHGVIVNAKKTTMNKKSN